MRPQRIARFTAALAVALGLLVGGALPAQAAPRFVDVDHRVQFFPEIQWLSQAGISTGWARPSRLPEYRPVTPVARDAMAAFLYRLAGSPAFTPPAQPTFRDVPAAAEHALAIEWMAAAGYTTGWDVGGGEFEFRPRAPIGRDATAAFLYRMAGSPIEEILDEVGFSDVLPGDPFHDEIRWLAHARISTGYPDGTFRPVAPVNHDAMAAFLQRFDARSNPLTVDKGDLPAGVQLGDDFAEPHLPGALAPCMMQSWRPALRYDGLDEATAWRIRGGMTPQHMGGPGALAGAVLVFPTTATAERYLESVRDVSLSCVSGVGAFDDQYGTSTSPKHPGWDDAVVTMTAMHEPHGFNADESLIARRGRVVVHHTVGHLDTTLRTTLDQAIIARVVAVLDQAA